MKTNSRQKKHFPRLPFVFSNVDDIQKDVYFLQSAAYFVPDALPRPVRLCNSGLRQFARRAFIRLCHFRRGVGAGLRSGAITFGILLAMALRRGSTWDTGD